MSVSKWTQPLGAVIEEAGLISPEKREELVRIQAGMLALSRKQEGFSPDQKTNLWKIRSLDEVEKEIGRIGVYPADLDDAREDIDGKTAMPRDVPQIGQIALQTGAVSSEAKDALLIMQAGARMIEASDRLKEIGEQWRQAPGQEDPFVAGPDRHPLDGLVVNPRNPEEFARPWLKPPVEIGHEDEVNTAQCVEYAAALAVGLSARAPELSETKGFKSAIASFERAGIRSMLNAAGKLGTLTGEPMNIKQLGLDIEDRLEKDPLILVNSKEEGGQAAIIENIETYGFIKDSVTYSPKYIAEKDKSEIKIHPKEDDYAERLPGETDRADGKQPQKEGFLSRFADRMNETVVAVIETPGNRTRLTHEGQILIAHAVSDTPTMDVKRKAPSAPALK